MRAALLAWGALALPQALPCPTHHAYAAAHPPVQVRHPGALPFSALVAALMVIMAAVFITQQQAFASSGPTKRRPLRSTERED